MPLPVVAVMISLCGWWITNYHPSYGFTMAGMVLWLLWFHYVGYLHCYCCYSFIMWLLCFYSTHLWVHMCGWRAYPPLITCVCSILKQWGNYNLMISTASVNLWGGGIFWGCWVLLVPLSYSEVVMSYFPLYARYWYRISQSEQFLWYQKYFPRQWYDLNGVRIRPRCQNIYHRRWPMNEMIKVTYISFHLWLPKYASSNMLFVSWFLSG